MNNYGVMEYFALCHAREVLAPYGAAYTATRYMNHIESAVSKAYLSGVTSGSILAFIHWHDGVDTWMYYILERHSWHFKRLVDFVIFTLSQRGLLPDLGEEKLYLCQYIIPPDSWDLGQVAECDDMEYRSFCERYMKKLFLAAGWTIQELSYEDIVGMKYLKSVTFPFISKDTKELCCYENVELEPDETCRYYIFTSEHKHYIPEQYMIFCRFCAGASFAVLDPWNVIVCFPETVYYNGYEMENGWSECCPFSALDAWIYHTEQKLFRTPRLELIHEA